MTLYIISLILCVLALAACFLRGGYGTIAAYAAMLCAYFAPDSPIDGSQLAFWGVATAIVLGLEFLQRGSAASAAARAYTVGGAITGAVLGVLCQPSSGAVIIGSAIGAVLGAVAFTRLPSGSRHALSSREFLDFLCARGLPAVVCASLLTVVALSVITVIRLQ